MEVLKEKKNIKVINLELHDNVLRQYKFLGKHQCPVVENATIERYLNRKNGDIEWFYVTEGFYNAKKIEMCPFCKMKEMN